MTPDIEVAGPVTGPAAAAVLDLASAAATADAVRPLSEHVLLHLRYGGDPQARDLLLPANQGQPNQGQPNQGQHSGDLAGYAHLDLADTADGPSGELVVHPAHRRHGLGLALTQAALAEAAPRPLRLWAHGDLPAAAGLARRAGFERIRALWTMRRALDTPLDAPRFPAGVTLRTFTVGADEQAWLDVNRKAFASHPEQGAWTMADLALREQEPWFDPAGFFLAERAGQLAGFHWTKIHQAGPEDSGDGPGAIGEVYVVGVDPGEQGSGLGRALTLAGLRYLRSRGLPEVMLYVDEANRPAIRLYESLGFTHWHTDVMYRHPGSG